MSTNTIALPLRYEYDNDTGPGDESFWEFYNVYDAKGAKFAVCKRKEDAALIVRCVNLHDALVEALEECLIGLAANENNLCARIAASKARAALAAAKEST